MGSRSSRQAAARQAGRRPQSRRMGRTLPASVVWAILRPTAVCATRAAKQFMSRSRHREGVGLPPCGGGAGQSAQSAEHVGTICVVVTELLANRCSRSTATVYCFRTVESASIGCNRPAGKLFAGGRVMFDQRLRKIRSSIRRAAVSEATQQGRRLSGARLLLLASQVR